MRNVNEPDTKKGHLKVVRGSCCSTFSPHREMTLGRMRWKPRSAPCLVVSGCARPGQGAAVCPQPHRGSWPELSWGSRAPGRINAGGELLLAMVAFARSIFDGKGCCRL